MQHSTSSFNMETKSNNLEISVMFSRIFLFFTEYKQMLVRSKGE